MKETRSDERSGGDLDSFLNAGSGESLFGSGKDLGQKTMSVISANTKIAGNVSTGGDMNIEGAVAGDTIANGALTITGSVTGNIESASLTIGRGRVEAQIINVKTDVVIEEGAEVIGNIQCQNLVANSNIKGNLLVQKRCELKVGAVVHGDVKAKELVVQSGAVIIGRMEIVTDGGR